MKKKFVGLRARKDNYLIDDGGEEKKQKAQKTVSWKENLNLNIITVSKQFNLKIKLKI